jgi:hypothetical protein
MTWRAMPLRGLVWCAVVLAGSVAVRPLNGDQATKPGETRAAAPSPSPKAPPLPRSLSHIVFSGGDGLGCDNAVKIEHAASLAQGEAAEKVWVDFHFPKARKIEHATTGKDGRHFEAFALKTAAGDVVNVCFDISDFFGKQN